jgi:replicative DNA helicase
MMEDIIMSINYTRDMAQKGSLLGFNTGFNELNNTLCGWVKPDLVIVAARPGMGKTAFMLSSIYQLACLDSVPLAVFSLEMSSEQLVERLESIGSQLPLKWLRMNTLDDKQRKVLLKTDDLLLTSPIHIEDMGGISVTQLRAKATILKQKYGIKVIFIDYLQLMSGTGKSNQNREQEVSYISRSLKALAKELEVPIIALSQLSRRVEERGDKMPQLSDLRESGSIEQDADAVIMLMRPHYYEMTEAIEIGGKEYSPSDLVVCKVEKNRHGSTKNIALRFLPETMKFEDYA